MLGLEVLLGAGVSSVGYDWGWVKVWVGVGVGDRLGGWVGGSGFGLTEVYFKSFDR